VGEGLVELADFGDGVDVFLDIVSGVVSHLFF
jgi:hypothetical protein